MTPEQRERKNALQRQRRAEAKANGTAPSSVQTRRPADSGRSGSAKDRVRCVAGQDYLEEHRLKPESPTRRLVATCCNSAMFLDFTKGHWLSMYRNRFAAGAPPLEMRMMTKERRDGVELADDVPNYPGYSGKFMMKLIGAWIAMGFRRPEIALGKTPGR